MQNRITTSKLFENKKGINMENKVNIYIKDGKYMVDAAIHTEVMTNDIADVQEHFSVDCACYFAEAIKEAIMNNSIIQKKIEEKEDKYNNTEFVKSGDKS